MGAGVSQRLPKSEPTKHYGGWGKREMVGEALMRVDKPCAREYIASAVFSNILHKTDLPIVILLFKHAPPLGAQSNQAQYSELALFDKEYIFSRQLAFLIGVHDERGTKAIGAVQVQVIRKACRARTRETKVSTVALLFHCAPSTLPCSLFLLYPFSF